jgi:hypothetical protein
MRATLGGPRRRYIARKQLSSLRGKRRLVAFDHGSITRAREKVYRTRLNFACRAVQAPGVPGAKNKKKEYLMRHLILTTAAILVIAGAATSSASAAKHHHHGAAPVAADAGAAPADTMDAHSARARNLRDAGYDAHKDMDANGNVRQN